MAQDNVTKIKKPVPADNFDTAMLAFQSLAVVAAKDSKNPHFRSNYASLEAVIEAAQQANQFGLYFMQPLDLMPIGDTVVQVVKTIITHAPSSEQRVSVCPVRSKDNNDPQKMGSGITYAKRYALQSAFGLPSEDDDGEAATGRNDKKPANQPTSQPQEF